MRRFLVCVGTVIFSAVIGPRLGVAAEIRVVDAGGLVRAVKVVRGNARLVISLSSSTQGECVAVNVDGLAAEKRVSVSPQGECVFTDVGVGSWQVQVPGSVGWRARIYE